MSKLIKFLVFNEKLGRIEFNFEKYSWNNYIKNAIKIDLIINLLTSD